jgi:MFS family permease
MAAASFAKGRSDWHPTAIYTLGLLTLISTFNYLDRSIIGLALPAIKSEMQVSDTALGLVSGLAFVLFYSILGVPIAWLADRWSRRNVIAIGLAFWSAMTVLTGFVVNIWQLAAARFLMGAGEACGLAPSHSMLSDVFRKERRPLVLAIFGTAFSIAFILFFPIAGYIAEHWGWRRMFIAAGLPGVALAGLFILTVHEPRRGAVEEREGKAQPESLPATVRFLLGSRTYLLLLLGVTFMGANIYAAGAWTPTFLVRAHGMSLSEIASSIGPMRGLLGAAGTLAGGILIDRIGRRDERWRVILPGIACVLLGPAEVLFLLGETPLLWMSGFALVSFLALVHQGPVFAAAMGVARVRMRAVASSMILFCAALLGQAVGPLFVGACNDLLEPRFGENAIRYSLLIVAVSAVIAGFAFCAAARYVGHDIQRAAAD